MILTLGDSFTYGDELSDRVTQAWPYLLGQMLDQPVTNLGYPGTCNASMIRKLLTHTSQHRYSLVVIGWTDPNRFEAWSELIQQPVTIMPESQAGLPWTNDYYRYSYDADWAWAQWINQVVLAQQYLISRNQPYVFISVAGDLDHSEHSRTNQVCQLINADRFVGWPDRGMIQFAGDCPCGPGGHPLELGHERIANEIAKYTRH